MGVISLKLGKYLRIHRQIIENIGKININLK
jgi:hypothetical protein